MVKAWLQDDAQTSGWDDRPKVFVRAGLSDDGCIPSAIRRAGEVLPVPGDDGAPTVNPILTVRVRREGGFDDDGVPLFTWATLVENQAIVWTQREEFDRVAGQTLVKARATLLYDGDEVVRETAGVWDNSGARWRVTSVAQVPGSLKLEMDRIDG